MNDYLNKLFNLENKAFVLIGGAGKMGLSFSKALINFLDDGLVIKVLFFISSNQ